MAGVKWTGEETNALIDAYGGKMVQDDIKSV